LKRALMATPEGKNVGISAIYREGITLKGTDLEVYIKIVYSTIQFTILTFCPQ